MLIKFIHQVLNKRVVVHVLFWALFVLIGSFLFSYQQNFPYSFFLLNFLVHLPVFLLFTYGVLYYLVPKLLLARKYAVFLLLLLLALCGAAFLRILVSRYVYYALFIPEFLWPKEWFSLSVFFINLIWILGPAVVFAMFKYYKNWINTQSLAQEAERKQLYAELQILKAQLNPHFLFNTFNNLYLLALQKSDKTPVVISKMSDLFHYILYECNAIEVPVSKEIKLIDDYIQLEGLRYAERLSVVFEKEIDNSDCLVPPMLLYTFVENCFKHGCSDDPGNPWIRLSLSVKENRFEFIASNSVPGTQNQADNCASGVGLANIRRRLELIYPKNHSLEIWKDDGVFNVMLIIRKNCTSITAGHA